MPIALHRQASFNKSNGRQQKWLVGRMRTVFCSPLGTVGMAVAHLAAHVVTTAAWLVDVR